jgi:dihydrofolate reductase
LTHEPPRTEGGSDIVIVDDLTGAVAAAKAAASVECVNVLGAEIARRFRDAGLLDETLVLIAPSLLGDGTRLFDHAGGTRVAWSQCIRAEPGRRASGSESSIEHVRFGPCFVPVAVSPVPQGRPASWWRPAVPSWRRDRSAAVTRKCRRL